MLALPTIQKRMRLYGRHEKAIKEAGEKEFFSRSSFVRKLFNPRSVNLLSGQNYLLSSVSTSSTNLLSLNTNNRRSIPRLPSAESPLFELETDRRKSLAGLSSSLRKNQRETSQGLSPSDISPSTHILSSACVSTVAAVAMSENSLNDEPTTRKCRFSSFAETKEYDIDSEEDKRDHLDEDEGEEDEQEDESGSDELFDEECLSDDRPTHNLSAAKNLLSKVGSGILTIAAAASIGSRHRLSLAEPSIRRFVPPLRKFGIDQASSARGSFLVQATPQTLGLSSLVPLLTSHESFRRCSDGISHTIRSKSTTVLGPSHQTQSPSFINDISNNLRPFSTSPTTRPDLWQTITPRASPAIFPSPTPSSLMPCRESDAARSSLSTTSNSYFTFSTCGPSMSARSSLNTPAFGEELVLDVTNFKQSADEEGDPLVSVLSPTETATTIVPADTSTPLISPSKSATQESLSTLQGERPKNGVERQSSTIRRSQKHREKIWQARANFFRSGAYADEPVIHSKSPLMLRRFVLDVENDPLVQQATGA